MKFFVFITSSELRVYDVERKEYIGINDSTSFKYCGNTDIENFCACIADQLGEEKFADLAATVTIVNCGANLSYVDKLHNVLEGCKEKNVLNVERILPLIAFNRGIKKEQELCFDVFGQFYLVESSTDNGICATNIDEPQTETIELKAEDFALVYRFVADGQCGEKLDVLRQQISDNEEAWKQKEIEWKSKFDSQQLKIEELEKENKDYRDKEQAELERQRKLEEERKKFKVGDIIKLGEWHSEPIEWQVLEVKDGKALLLSKYALAVDAYFDAYNFTEYLKWENCSVREWLNNEFYREAYSGTEKNALVEGNVPAHYNPEYDTNPGNNTIDRIFLLSVKEVLKYFSKKEERICCAKPWVGKKVLTFPSGECAWLLRSPGSMDSCLTCVDQIGDIRNSNNCGNIGMGRAEYDASFRPACWVDLSKL